MARAEGAPGDGIESYMEGVAARLEEELGIEGVATDDPALFLDSLDAKGVIPVQTFAEPSDDRVSPEEALGDGLVSLGDGVDPRTSTSSSSVLLVLLLALAACRGGAPAPAPAVAPLPQTVGRPLLPALEDPDPTVRRGAAEQLGGVRNASRRVIDALLFARHDEVSGRQVIHPPRPGLAWRTQAPYEGNAWRGQRAPAPVRTTRAVSSRVARSNHSVRCIT